MLPKESFDISTSTSLMCFGIDLVAVGTCMTFLYQVVTSDIYHAAALWQQALMMTPLQVLTGFAMRCMWCIGHDAGHSLVWKSKTINQVVGEVAHSIICLFHGNCHIANIIFITIIWKVIILISGSFVRKPINWIGGFRVPIKHAISKLPFLYLVTLFIYWRVCLMVDMSSFMVDCGNNLGYNANRLGGLVARSNMERTNDGFYRRSPGYKPPDNNTVFIDDNLVTCPTGELDLPKDPGNLLWCMETDESLNE